MGRERGGQGIGRTVGGDGGERVSCRPVSWARRSSCVGEHAAAAPRAFAEVLERLLAVVDEESARAMADSIIGPRDCASWRVIRECMCILASFVGRGGAGGARRGEKNVQNRGRDEPPSATITKGRVPPHVFAPCWPEGS